MLGAVASMAALPYHYRAAMAAEQLIGQQILGLRPYPHRGAAIDLEHFLHLVECGPVCQRGHTALIADVVKDVHTGVLLIFQQAVQAVDGEFATASCPDSLCVKPRNDFRDGLAVGVSLKNFCYIRCSFGVTFVTLSFWINYISQHFVSANRH